MNLMGMGMAEIAVVMVVAFLVLGPNRTINLARTAGKLFADLRRTFNEVTAAITLEERGESGSPQSDTPQAGTPQAGTPWESRPVAQPPQEESAPTDIGQEDIGPEDTGPEDMGAEGIGPAGPNGQAPAKNGDE